MGTRQFPDLVIEQDNQVLLMLWDEHLEEYHNRQFNEASYEQKKEGLQDQGTQPTTTPW